MKKVLTLLLFAVALPAWSAEVTLEVKLIDKVAIVTAKTDAKVVVWIPTAGLSDVIPTELLRDTKTRALTGKPGLYRVIAVVSPQADQPSWADVTFTIGTPEPEPVIPVPPPLPVDNLTKRLKDAYAVDASPGKRGQLVNLMAVYSVMAQEMEKKDVKTSRSMLDLLTKTKEGMLVDGVLVEMRRIIATEIAAAIGPASDAPLDRDMAQAMFRRIVAALPRPE